MDRTQTGRMGGVTADEEREERRHQYVKSSSRRVWRITAVACIAILGLGLGTAAVIRQQAIDSRQRHTSERERDRDRQLARQQAADLACVKRWADAYTQRADRLNELASLRSDALDRLVVAAAGPDQAITRARLLDYLDASRRYRATTANDPLPPSPVFACGITPSAGPTPYRPGPTSPNRVPPVRPTSTARTAGRSPATPAPTTRRASPAGHDTSRSPGRPVAASSSGGGGVAPRPGGPSGPVQRPTPPGVVRIPLPLPVCIAVRPLLETC